MVFEILFLQTTICLLHNRHAPGERKSLFVQGIWALLSGYCQNVIYNVVKTHIKIV